MALDATTDRGLRSTHPIDRPELLRKRPLATRLSDRLTSAASKDRWLVQVRWVAVAGMSATILVARLFVPALRLGELVALVALVAGSNVGWNLLARRSSRDFVPAQLFVDLLLLTSILWFSGGLQNPFTVFITFQVALAGVLCDGRVTLAVGLLAIAATALLSWAPPLAFEGAAFGRVRIEAVGRLAAVVSLCVFLGVFALVYARRLQDLRDARLRDERLAMLGRLVGAMSHELATPLGTIVLGSHDLVELTKGVSLEAAELAIAVAAEAERASDIIGLLRGHVRPDQRAELVDLAELVPELARRELDRLGFSGIRLVEAPSAVPAVVLRVGLGQVLRNLLANAVHATADMSPPRERRVQVSVRVVDEAAVIEVIDNGSGFSPEIAERLGEPFQTTKEGSGGLGLGLYVSAMLARQMNASLRVDDADGGGAKVTLTIDRQLEDRTT